MMWPLALWMFPLLCRFSLAALPQKPENISCIFYYGHNVTCTWNPEKEVNDTWYTVKRTYIYGRKNDSCTSKNRASCSFFYPEVTTPDTYIIEVEARNADGIIRSNTTQWTLDNIMKTEPPEIYDVKPILGVKQMVQVQWRRPVLAPLSSILKCTLRFRAVNSTQWLEVNFTTNSTHPIQVYNLTELQPFTEYVLTLRCRAKYSNFWSDWSQEKKGTTEEQAPVTALDLWRVLRPAGANGRLVHLLWKEARGAPVLGETLGYKIWYFPENNTNLTKTMNTTNQQLDLYVGCQMYWVSVISYNSMGKSPEATIRIPASHEKTFQCIEAMQAWLTEDQLVVEWKSSAPEVDRWLVEWVPDLDSEPTTFSWEYVSQARNWTVDQGHLLSETPAWVQVPRFSCSYYKDKLKPLVCYNISVYPILQDQVGESYSIQAYIKEGVPTNGPVTKAEHIDAKTVKITWEEIPKRKRHGFIKNYTIFYQAEDGEELSKTVDSSILQYDLGPLTRNTPYSVWVMASTSAGGAKGEKINFKTLSFSVVEIVLITSLVGGSLLIFVVLMMIYGLEKPHKLKHLCWPDVPNPAESSIAMWRGDDFKNKLALKEAQFYRTMNTAIDKISKPQYDPSDFIDKLVVNFEYFVEDASIEEPLKPQKKITVGWEKNEYVTSPNMPYCPVGKSFQEIPPRKAENPSEGMPEEACLEAREQLLSSGQSLSPDPLYEDGAPNPYLKNSVTTREFVSEKLPDQAERED